MIRQKVGTATLRVIVPDFAKSAGTLIALGADWIVMSDTSELGPIDPQVIRSDSDGNRMAHSVLSYLEAFEHHAEVLRQDPGNIASQIMLNKLDPGTLKQFEAIRTRPTAQPRTCSSAACSATATETGPWRPPS